jgi:hypothetical protein
MATFTRPHPFGQGTQTLHTFRNGYGASLVEHSFSYGLELGVVKLAISEDPWDGFVLATDTPIADDGVLGHMNEETLAKALADIEALPNQHPNESPEQI